MSEHRAAIAWRRTSAGYSYDTYNRAFEYRFKGGELRLAGSSAPEFKGDADRVDPEEGFVASLSACHMLTFLAICARKRLTVDAYEDDASGWLEKAENGRLWIARVTLRPRIRFGGDTNVDSATLAQLHRQSHVECFIANSVKTEISVEPQA